MTTAEELSCDISTFISRSFAVVTTTRRKQQMKEYVKESTMFFELTKGTRTHWAIRREPEVYTDMSGRDKIQSGYYRHIGSITGRSVDGHLILLEIDLVSKHPAGQDYAVFMQQIEQEIQKRFPLATAGAWTE